MIFNDRLNVLIGPNGSGKSTILGTLAKAAGCGSGGWSDQDASRNLDFQIHLTWDKLPVFFQDCYQDSEHSFLNPDYFEEHEYLRSTGEKRIGLINELITYFENRFLTYKLKITNRPTLILDEVDNHIGFAGQAVLWKEIFPLLIKKYQLIVSTHSIMPLLLKKDNSLRQDNIIQLHKDYSNICIRELADAIERFNSSRGE